MLKKCFVQGAQHSVRKKRTKNKKKKKKLKRKIKKKKKSRMDAYLREVGIEMETFAVNGVRVNRETRGDGPGERSYESIVRSLLIRYILGDLLF